MAAIHNLYNRLRECDFLHRLTMEQTDETENLVVRVDSFYLIRVSETLEDESTNFVLDCYYANEKTMTQSMNEEQTISYLRDVLKLRRLDFMKDRRYDTLKKIIAVRLHNLSGCMSKWTMQISITVAIVAVLVPFIVLGVCTFMDQAVWGLIAMFGFWGGILVFLWLRKSFYRHRMFVVPHGEQYVKVEICKDFDHLNRMYANASILFFNDFHPDRLDIIYNWLYSMQALPQKELHIYVYSGEDLRNHFAKEHIKEDDVCLCIDCEELSITDDNRNRFYKELPGLHGRKLGDYIDAKQPNAADIAKWR